MKYLSTFNVDKPIGAMADATSHWHFLSNHAHILLLISSNPDLTVRELAAGVGITERAVIRIIGELDEGGYLERTREGRRNHYTIHEERSLRHEVEAHCSVGDLIRMYQAGLPGGNGTA